MKLKEFFGLKHQNQKKKQKKRSLTSEAMKGTNLLDDMASLSIVEMCEGAGRGGGGGDGEEKAHTRSKSLTTQESSERIAEKEVSAAAAIEAAKNAAMLGRWPALIKWDHEEVARIKASVRSASKLTDREVHTAGIEAAKAADKADRLMERHIRAERRGIAKDQRDELRDELRAERKENPSTPPTSAPSAPSDTGDEISLPHLPQGKHTLPPGLSAVAAVQQVQRGKGRNPMNSKKSEKSSDKSKSPQQKTSEKTAEQIVSDKNTQQIGKNQSIGKGQLVRKSQIVHTDKDKSY